jgi:putative ABC transport system ATP-binding protein
MNALRNIDLSVAAPPATDAVLSANGIFKRFGKNEARVDALKNVGVHINAGEFCALCGPSGSGKSTLLNILGCLDRPDAGEIWLDGVEVPLSNENSLRDLRRSHFGFVFQNFNLVPTLSAVENVEMALFHAPKKHGKKREMAREMLELVGLGDRMEHRPAALSGGQQQRVAVARALVRHPKLIFADEPTANLDATNAFELMDVMEKLREQSGCAFIISTHDARLMDRFGRIVTLEDGRIIS